MDSDQLQGPFGVVLRCDGDPFEPELHRLEWNQRGRIGDTCESFRQSIESGNPGHGRPDRGQLHEVRDRRGNAGQDDPAQLPKGVRHHLGAVPHPVEYVARGQSELDHFDGHAMDRGGHLPREDHHQPFRRELDRIQGGVRLLDTVDIRLWNGEPIHRRKGFEFVDQLSGGPHR